MPSPGVATFCKDVCHPSERTARLPPLAAALVHCDREFSFASASSVQRAEPGPQQGLCSRTVCRRNVRILLSVVPSPTPSPAGFSGRPALSPARSEVSAPSALASHRQTAAGSGPAAASQLSRHRLASLVTEQRREKRSTAYRPVVLSTGVEVGVRLPRDLT